MFPLPTFLLTSLFYGIIVDARKEGKCERTDKRIKENIKFYSSNRKVATVSSHGKVTGKQEGVATITLKMKSGAKATCKIKVTKPKTNSSQQPGGSGSNPGGSEYGPGGTDTPTPPPSGYVWIPNSGRKYHSSSSCSGMKGPRQVTLQEAINSGYEPCSKCY